MVDESPLDINLNYEKSLEWWSFSMTNHDSFFHQKSMRLEFLDAKSLKTRSMTKIVLRLTATIKMPLDSLHLTEVHGNHFQCCEFQGKQSSTFRFQRIDFHRWDNHVYRFKLITNLLELSFFKQEFK